MAESHDATPRAAEEARWVLLSGGIKPSPLIAATGGSTLDLSLTGQRTILEQWIDAAHGLGRAGWRPSRVSVVYTAHSPRPHDPRDAEASVVEIIADPRPLRGTAGTMRDVCADEPPDRLVLVVEGARLLMGGAAPMVREHLATGADITVAMNPDGAPGGLYVLRRRALDTVSSAGFMDLKEQWLGRARAAGMDIRVHRLPGRGALPLRTREQFLVAAMALAGRRDARLAGFRVFEPASAIREEPFGVIAAGAHVGPGAVVVDSVVMDGAEIGAGAVVVRSVVAGGGRVEPGAEVVDAVVSKRGVVSDAGAVIRT